MPNFYLVTRANDGSEVRTLLQVRRYGINSPRELHLKASKRLKRTIKTLALDENLPIKSTQPLFHLDSPYAVSLQAEGLEVVRADPTAPRSRVARSLGTVMVAPVDDDDGFITMMSGPGVQPFTAILHADKTRIQGRFAVWSVHVIVATDQVDSLQIAGMLTAARIERVIDLQTKVECGVCGHGKPRRRGSDDNDERASSEICAHIGDTITSGVMTDAQILSAFHVAYSIEADHSLFATDLGHTLLTSNSSPAAAISLSPENWVARAAEQLHTNAGLGFGDAYRRDAEEFGQQLTAGALDFFRDAWSKTTRGVRASIEKFMPSADTIAALKAINVKKLAARTQTVLTSKTVEAVITTLTTNPGDIVYLREWGKAVLGDLKLDESEMGKLVIDNAPAAEEALRRVIGKFKMLRPDDFSEYGAQFRQLVGNPDLADGVIQLAVVAKNAAQFVARNADKAAAAAKTAVNLAAAGAGAVASSGQ